VASFSVVIAAYEAAAVVGGAVRSALEQVPAPHEVIVADDGGTDDLAAALAGFGDRVRLVRIDHGGEAAAKNAGAAAATGEFVVFLDADDRYRPGRLAALGALADRRPDLDVLTTDADLVHDGEVVGRCYGEGHPFVADGQREAILRRNFVFGHAAVRRASFEAVGGFDPAVAYTTDWDLWVRLVFTGSAIGLVPEPLSEYHLHPTSMSARRAAMSRGRLQTLARAAARTDLSPAERATVDATARAERAVLAREELMDALATGDARVARRAATRVVAGAGQSPGTRLRAFAAVLAPGRAGARVRRDRAQSFLTVGGRRLPRADHGGGTRQE
jgi:ParB-like chromosome segregation protein Spo0J